MMHTAECGIVGLTLIVINLASLIYPLSHLRHGIKYVRVYLSLCLCDMPHQKCPGN